MNCERYSKIVASTVLLCSQYYDLKTFQHCLRVAKYTIDNVCLSSEDEKEIAFIVALCHDLLEDTSISIDQIAQATGFSTNFLSNVLGSLTRQESESYLEYIQRLKRNTSPYPYIIKLADMKDHLSQKETLTERLKEKYWEALPELL